MTQNFSQGSVQSALGYYFKTPSLISAAFTHVSFSETENNETLIFLGERLLDFIISDYVSSHYPFSTEKQLFAHFDSFKKAIGYKNFISDKKLDGYIRLSTKCEDLRDNKSLHGEIFLAVCAAIYKDGGIASFKSFILPLIRAVDSESRYTPKTDPQPSSNVDVRSRLSDTYSEEKPNTAKVVSVPSVKEKDEEKSPKTKTAKVKAEKDKAKKETESEKNKKTAKAEKLAAEKEEAVKEKKGAMLLKAIMLPTKGRKKDEKGEKVKTTSAEKTAETVENNPKSTENKRSFIRDALAPVSLPESMRNPRPKKPFKATNEASVTEASLPSATAENSYSDDTENYKSILQEYVQKNIRTASVLIKYTTERKGNVFVSELTLDGKPLARAEGSVKKSAEKEAARIAYSEITNAKNPLYSWFNTLSAETPEKTPDNYISKLNEYYQKKSRSSAAPLTYEPRPSGEKKTFAVAIMFNGEELSVGKGHTVKDAKQSAAQAACEKLNIK